MTPTYYHLDQTTKEPSDAAEFVWIVTDYRYECWEGSGHAVGLHRSGDIYELNLGHCSCYGEFETSDNDDEPLGSGTKYTVSDYLRDLDDAICETPRLKRKVAELLGIVELKESL